MKPVPPNTPNPVTSEPSFDTQVSDPNNLAFAGRSRTGDDPSKVEGVDAAFDNVFDRLQRPSDQVAIGDPIIRVHRNQMFELSVKELAAITNKNPKHPSAEVFKKAIRGRAISDKVTVEKMDLLAIIDNKAVETVDESTEEVIDGVPTKVRTFRKVLGEVLKQP